MTGGSRWRMVVLLRRMRRRSRPRLDRRVAAERGTTIPAFAPIPAGTPDDANGAFFPETGHRLCFGFTAYWENHGLEFGDPGVSHRESLALFGYPISEEFTDPDTGPTVQYFERARFGSTQTTPNRTACSSAASPRTS